MKLHAIVQRNPTPQNDALVDFPLVKVYRSNTEILTDENVDLVIVSTPPTTHFALCKEALEAGKHGECLCYVTFLLLVFSMQFPLFAACVPCSGKHNEG